MLFHKNIKFKFKFKFKPRLRRGYHRPRCNTEYNTIFVANVPHKTLEEHLRSVVQNITEIHKSDVIFFITYVHVSSAEMITKLTKQCDVFPCKSSRVKIQQLNLTKRKRKLLQIQCDACSVHRPTDSLQVTMIGE